MQMELGEARDIAEMAVTRLKSVSTGANPADWRAGFSVPKTVCRRQCTVFFWLSNAMAQIISISWRERDAVPRPPATASF
jgi:hypothetical protein